MNEHSPCLGVGGGADRVPAKLCFRDVVGCATGEIACGKVTLGNNNYLNLYAFVKSGWKDVHAFGLRAVPSACWEIEEPKFRCVVPCRV